MKTESGGLFSRFKANPLLAVLIFLLLGCMVVMGFIVAQLLTYSDKDQLKGRYVDTTPENFDMSLDISCYSFTALAQRLFELA